MLGGVAQKMSFSTPPRSVERRAASTTNEARAKAKTISICNGFQTVWRAPKLFESSFGAPELDSKPSQFGRVLLLRGASFVVLAALLWTDRGGVEKDIFSRPPPNTNLNYLKASWPKTSKSTRRFPNNCRFDFEVFGHEALL